MYYIYSYNGIILASIFPIKTKDTPILKSNKSQSEKSYNTQGYKTLVGVAKFAWKTWKKT